MKIVCIFIELGFFLLFFIKLYFSRLLLLLIFRLFKLFNFLKLFKVGILLYERFWNVMLFLEFFGVYEKVLGWLFMKVIV